MHAAKGARIATITLLAGILVLRSPAVFAQDYQDWKYTHPKPQANTLRKMQMIDVNNWVAVGANGTFMRTTDGGVTWYFHHQAGVPSNAAQQIGQNFDLRFTSPTTGLVVGAMAFVGRTTDGGMTFTNLASGIPTTQSCNGLSFGTATLGFIAAGTGSGFAGTIARTTDGGLTWAPVLTTTATVNSVAAVDAVNAHAVLANGGIVNTTDGGSTWSAPVPGTVQALTNMAFVNTSTGFVVGSSGTINKTTDGGLTWTPLTPPQMDFTFFQMKVFSAAEIYAVGAPDFLYRSTDLGATWTPLPIIPVAGPADINNWYALERQGAVMVMSGDLGVLAQSNNGGTAWTSNNFLLKSALSNDIQELPATNIVVAVGRQRLLGTRQVLRSTDGGNNWTSIDIPVTTDLNASSFPTSQIGYACGTGSQVVKTTDAGLTRAAVTSPVGGGVVLQAVDFVDTNTGWVVVNSPNTGNNIFKTTSGGATWTPQTTGNTDQLVAVDMVDANVGYIARNTGNGPIYKTTNGGTNWTAVPQPFTGQIRDLRAIDTNLVYIGSNAGTGTNRVGKSTNGGANWQQIALPVAIDLATLDFSDANNGLACGNTTTAVCKTTDGGATWSFQNVHLPAVVRVYLGPTGTGWTLGTTSAILRNAPAGNMCQVCHKGRPLTFACNSMEYNRHLDHGDLAGPCSSTKGEE